MATLGGFHPDFHPEPAVFPSLKRILITVDDDQLPDAIELSASGYMAITSNTIQFGAEFTAAIKSGNWKLEGKIGGDALIRLPFYFDVTIKGSVHVKYRGRNLVGVKFKGGLSGPSPLVLRGEVCISLLLFDACWSDSFELGSAGDIAGAALASLVSVLAAELETPGNLTVAEGEDGLVLIARHDTSDRVVVSPLGVPTWSQNRVPLGLPVEKYEDGTLDSPQRLEVTASVPTASYLDWFSPGSFVELSDAEALALPAFERHQAGVIVTLDETRSTPVTKPLGFEQIKLPSSRRFVDGLTIPARGARADGGDDGATVDPAAPGPLRRGRRPLHRPGRRRRCAGHRGGRGRRPPRHARRGQQRPARSGPRGGADGLMPTLQFFGWWRPPGAAAVSSGGLTAGRLTARLTLTARDVDQPSDAATRNVAYDLFGPGDVTGLGRGAVVHTYPSPGAGNVEVEKAVYAELGAPDLPWRHSVALPQGKALRPWIVLLVGTPEEIEVAGATVRLQPSVLDAHPLATSARGAHVEDDGSRRIARLISSRALLPRP